MTIAYIGLGSNLTSRLSEKHYSPQENIVSAIASLGNIKSTSIVKISSLYQSKPVGPQDQDDYINAVAMLNTQLDALELLDNLQAIENQHGRERKAHWGARTLDLDILLFAEQVIENERLTVPHKEIGNRSFVLVPLMEVEPECIIPGKGNISDIVLNVDKTGLKVIE